MNRQFLKSYAFVADGETEKWYLQCLKQNERKLKINLKPEFPTKKLLKEQFELVCKLASDYSGVFWIVDLDTIIKEKKEAKTGGQTAKEELEKYLNDISRNEKFSNIYVVVNTPCLEYWFLLHSKQTTKYYAKCDDVIKDIKKSSPLLKDYKKSEKYYKRGKLDIYQKLQPDLQKALEHSKGSSFDIQNMEKGLSEMRFIFKVLGLCDEQYKLKK